MSQIPQQFYYKKNRLQQLRGFYYTVQTGSLSKAASKMGLTQSTITLQIQSLERDLGTKLLDRSTKLLGVTKDGKLFYSMASYHLSGIDSLYSEFLKKREQKEIKINIAVHHVAISYLIPPYIKEFQEKYPKVKIGIQNIGAKEAIKRLQDNEIDCILYPNIDISDEFLAKTCFSFDPILIMSKDHPLASKKEIQPQDIAKYNTVRIDKKLISLPLFEQTFKEFGFKTNIEFENGNWSMIKGFVRSGIGLGFVSEICIDKDDSTIIYKNLNKFFPSMQYQIITKNGRKLNNLTQDFIDILTAPNNNHVKF